MAALTGARGVENVSSSQRRIDMSSKILELQPDAAPLTVLTKNLTSRPTGNPKFSGMEIDLEQRFDKVSNGAGYNSSATSIVVANGALFAQHYIVYATRTGEAMLVQSVSTNTLTVKRGVGSTAAALVDQDELLVASIAQPEDDTSRPARTNNPTQVDNYTQIFRTPIDFSGSWLHSENQTTQTDDETLQENIAGIEHKKDIEYAFMVGHPSNDTSGSMPRRTTGGFKHFVTQNVTDMGGTMTEAEFNAFLRSGFRYGNRTKLLLASALAIDVINNYGLGKLQILQPGAGQSTYGLNIRQFISPHGTVNIVTHWLLEGATLGGQAWLVDLEPLAYRYLANQKRGARDTMLLRNRQETDRDGEKSEYLTECGMHFGQDKRHAIALNITG